MGKPSSGTAQNFVEGVASVEMNGADALSLIASNPVDTSQFRRVR